MTSQGAFTASDPWLVFIAPPHAETGLEIRINFGVFAGRNATAAEIDDLAARLIPEVGEVSIIAEQRHELSEDVEASIHQVRVEVEDDRLPDDADKLASLSERLVRACEMWARRATDARHVDV